MNRPDLLKELATRPLVCDGAMGTQLLALGFKSGECATLWNVDRPADVRAIHDAYLAAGCELITTNTFGGSSIALDRHGLAARSAELNEAAAKIAREAAGDRAWVLGDVGPFGDFLEPFGETTAEALRESFRLQIEGLLAGGADAVLVETMSDPAEAVAGVEAAKEVDGNVPVVVTYAFQEAGPGVFKTMMGTSVEEAVSRAVAAGARMVGANCGTSLDLGDYVELGKQLAAAADGTPVVVQPNAGAPRMLGEETVYDATPGQMAAAARELLQAGVRIVGGCCGTTPEHLAAVASAVRHG
ncbi:MAG: homocysteine S-methyltransferase family protein [Opitutales bacterium]|nr:homocysteine S-methyltransferase family protein [Opitutales bacterium]